MSDDERQYIEDEIQKSGFPLEIEIASILKGNRWGVNYSSPFFDRDDEKWRELDIEAYTSSSDDPQQRSNKSINNLAEYTSTIDITPTGVVEVIQIDNKRKDKSIKPYRLVFDLVIECKKNRGFAWVFFTQPRSKEINDLSNAILLDFLTVVQRQSSLKQLKPISEEECLEYEIPISLLDEEALVVPTDNDQGSVFELFEPPPLAFQKIRQKCFKRLSKMNIATTYIEISIDKKLRSKSIKSSPTEIFDAVNKVSKALKERLINSSYRLFQATKLSKARINLIPTKLGGVNLDIEIFVPIIVFDGKLYSWSDGHVEEENEILLKAKCHTKQYYEDRLISVVKKEHFQNFLKDLNDDFVNLYNLLYINKRQLDKLATEIIG